MTKVQDLTRRNVVFGVLAALLLVYLVLRPPQTSAVGTEDLPSLFPGFEIANVRSIVLERVPAGEAVEPADPLAAASQETELTLARSTEDAWVVASKGDYPADATKVNALLEDVAQARRKKVVTERPEAFAEYAGPQGWTRVRILGAAGKELASFELGKSAQWPDAFAKVDVDGSPRIVRAHNLRTDRAPMQFSSWVEARLWPGLTLDDVMGIDVFRTGEKDTLSFVRNPEAEKAADEGEATPEWDAAEGDEADATPKPPAWLMKAPRPGEPESFKVENLVRAFTGMRLADVVAPQEVDEEAMGLAKPAYRIVAHLRPLKEGAEPKRHVLLIGAEKPKDDGTGSGFWFAKKRDEPWVYLVRTASVGDFRLPTDDFLPKEEAPSDTATPAPGEGADGAPPPQSPEGSPDGQGGGDAPPAVPGGTGAGTPDGDAAPPPPPTPPEVPDDAAGGAPPK